MAIRDLINYFRGGSNKSSVVVRSSSGERVRLTAEQEEVVLKQGAEQYIAGVKSLMEKVRAMCADPSAADLSNIEGHLKTAEEQFAAKQYREAIMTLQAPVMALQEVIGDFELNHSGRQGKLVSLSVSVKAG